MAQLRFDGRVAVVTGAGRGIGREHALLLASRGAAVVVNDFGGATDGSGASTTPADEVVAEIVAAGGKAVANHLSVAADGAGEAIVGTACEHFGRIDIVVSNAGIFRNKPFAEHTLDDFRRVMDVHFYGTLAVCHAAWPHFVRAGYGRIVNTTSAGMLGFTLNSTYGAAKGAVFGLTNNLALEGAPLGIVANCIAPAAATRMLVDALPPEEQAPFMAAMPAAMVSPAAAYLAHESCTLTGALLATGGGHVHRWMLRESDGLADRDLTIEDVRDNIASIVEPGGLAAAGVEEQMNAILVTAQESPRTVEGAFN
jgi:hypothetical protein